jgi:transposase
LLFVGDDWAEAHHDIEVMNASGRRLVKVRVPEGAAGMARLHATIAELLPDDVEDVASLVKVGIETDRGPWVQALIAAGYTVFAVNPLQAARYRERLVVSGSKSDAADAHMLADMVRTDSHQLRVVAADTAEAEAVKVVTRMHKTLIWERTRAARPAGLLSRSAASVRGPRRARHPATAGQSAGPGERGQAEHRADQCRAHPRSAPARGRQGHGDSGGAAR